MKRSLYKLLLMVAVATVPLIVPFQPAGASGRYHGPSGASTHFAAGLVGPKKYYLALGDSLAYGLQPNFQFNKGYANDFYTNLAPYGTSKLIDMGCPGETSATFLGGGCPERHFLKYHYSGPQMGAALSYIKSHHGQVSPVTLDIGGNDFLNYFDPTTCQIITPTGGINAAVQQFDVNFITIVANLQQALGGQGDIVVMNYYDPFANLCHAVSPLIDLLNSHLLADAQHMGVPLADVYDAFGGSKIPNPDTCPDTWMCGTFPKSYDLKVHPTTTGYSVIANQFEQTTGY